MVVRGRTCKKMALLIPLYALDTALMTLPDLLRYLRHINGPQEDLVASGSRQLPVVLPGDVHYLAWLHKSVESLLLYRIWVPDEHVCFIPTRGYEGVRIVPNGDDQRVLRPEEAFKLALHTPDSSYVVIGTRQQLIAVVIPLDARYVVVLVSSVRHLVVIRKTDVPQLHPGCLGIKRLTLHLIEVPDIDEAVPSSSSGQDLLVWVPFGEKYVSLVLTDNSDALAVRYERYSISTSFRAPINDLARSKRLKDKKW